MSKVKALALLLAGGAIGAAALAAVSGSGSVEEVRIAARWLSASRFEVGLQQRQADGAWGDVVEPELNVVGSRSSDWAFSSSVAVRPSAADGVVSFHVTPESIYAVSGPIADTRCDYAFIFRAEQDPTVWFEGPIGGFCSSASVREPLLVPNDGQVPVDPEDPQAEYVSSWLWRLEDDVRYLGGDDLTLAEFEAAMALAYQDFMPPSARPPSIVYEAGLDVTLHNFDTNEILTGLESISPSFALNLISYHLTSLSDELGVLQWSGPELAAQVLAVYQRYVPWFNVGAARDLAGRLGVLVAQEAPVAPVRPDNDMITGVRQLLGLSDPLSPVETDLLGDDYDGPVKLLDIFFRTVNGVLTAWSPIGPIESNCDFFAVVRGYSAVWVRPDQHQWGACASDGQLIHVGSVEGVNTPFDPDDPQQFLVHDWERQVRENLLPEELGTEITLEWAQAIMDTVFADLFGSDASSPRALLEYSSEGDSYYTNELNHGRIPSDQLSALSILHEAAHAALSVQERFTFAEWRDHGGYYAATILMFWERYVPGFDGERARAAAASHGVEVSTSPPVFPVGGAVGAAAVTEALGLGAAGMLR